MYLVFMYSLDSVHRQCLVKSHSFSGISLFMRLQTITPISLKFSWTKGSKSVCSPDKQINFYRPESCWSQKLLEYLWRTRDILMHPFLAHWTVIDKPDHTIYEKLLWVINKIWIALFYFQLKTRIKAMILFLRCINWGVFQTWRE